MRILSMAESSKPLLKLGMQSWICTPEASVRTSTQSMTSGARLAWQSGIAGSRDREPDVMHLYYPSRRQPSAAFTLVVGCRTPP